MKATSIDTAIHAGKSALNATGRAIDELAARKESIADALEQGTRTARQVYKQTRGAAEDLVYDAKRNIKRFPLRSVAIAFGAGALLGLLIARNNRS